LGCGPNAAVTSWLDFDGSWNARLNKLPLLAKAARKLRGGGLSHKAFPAHVRYLELTKPLPFADNFADAIYASHVWEHLYYGDALALTRECRRVLKPGGRLRVLVPNLRDYITEYISREPGATDAAFVLNKKMMFRNPTREKRPLLRFYTALTDFHSHKFMYDPPALIKLFADAGFSNPSERACFDSGIAEIREVESAGRCGPGIGFAVEAEKI
jgi:SAM-dependent methyltransferase